MKKNSTISERLTEYMEKNTLRVSDLERLTGIHRGTFSNYIYGRYRPKENRVNEIAEKLGISSSWLNGYDVPMKDEISNGSSRSIPIVGTIACGVPIFAAENIEGYFDIEKESNADFCLFAKGNSMIGDGIEEGDVVFIKQDSTFENGDIVVCLIEDDATLKHYYRHSDDILILKASNPRFQDIVITKKEHKQVQILGVCVGIYKRFEK